MHVRNMAAAESPTGESGSSGVTIEEARRAFMPSYKQAPVVLTRGEGMHVWSEEGRRYLDFVAGIAVTSVGHSHPLLVAAIVEQAQDLLHTSAMFFNRPSMELAKVLCERAGFDARVFFSNSGAEANEAAVKLARRYFRNVRKEDRYAVVTAEHSFHGRTLAMTAATGQPKYQQGYEPLPAGFSSVPYDDLAALEGAMAPHVAAVMLEPIQGEGGIRVPSPGYLRAVRALCDRHGALLILDEVQTGNGRTGTFFAYEHEGVFPDVVTTAKGLGGGVPIGVTLARREVAEAFQPGAHASTFGGGPLACRAALAVLDIIDREGLLDNAQAMGEYLTHQLGALASDARVESAIAGIRGRGLMVGVELRGLDPLAVVAACRERGLLINVAGTSTLRFVPPLIVQKGHIRAAVDILRDVLLDMVATAGRRPEQNKG